MTRPNFVYIGAPRAGSTWMYKALRAHPQVFVPMAKYVKYFHEPEEKRRSMEWYESFFADATPEQRAIGELTPGYLYSDMALTRIAEELPGVKLVATLRNPIERDWSAYLHMKRNGQVTGTFAEEMNGEFRFIRDYGCYADYLPRLFELFPRERVKLFVFDDLSRHPERFARELYEFLGVDPDFTYEDVAKPQYAAREARSPVLAKATSNVAMLVRQAGMPNLIGWVKTLPGLQSALYKPTSKKSSEMISIDDRHRLIEKHRDGVAKLGAMLNRDLSHWLEQGAQQGPAA